MDRYELQRLSTNGILRLRDRVREELLETPEHLYPGSYELLRRRQAVLNEILADRSASSREVVQLRDGYDVDAPLECALEPRQLQ